MEETGRGEGEGFTINVPLPVGCGDNEYLGIFDQLLKPITFEFNPDIILVSAGFDIYVDDPLGGMRVTPPGVARLTRSVMDIAEGCCNGKIVISLEGGYHVEGQRDSVKEVLMELSGLSDALDSDLREGASNSKTIQTVITEVKKIQKQFIKKMG